MAKCNKCKNDRCGCSDSPLSIPANFSNDPTVCPPNSEQCTELFSMACICYDGDDIVELDIQRGDRLDEILQKLILAVRSPECAVFEDDATCQAPINLMVANLTSTSFEISWDPCPTATSYVVEYKEASSPTWLIQPGVPAPTVADTVIGLTPDTIYDIRVNAICPSDNCYSLNIRIKTLPTQA